MPKKRRPEAGNRYGMLTVIDWADKPGYVTCKCDCGKVCTVSIGSLRSGARHSCGCIREKIISLQRKYNTNFLVLTSDKAYKNNACGVKGVCYLQKQNKYAAYITLHGKTRSLGRYNTLADAACARKAAEEEQFTPLIHEYLANFT